MDTINTLNWHGIWEVDHRVDKEFIQATIQSLRDLFHIHIYLYQCDEDSRDFIPRSQLISELTPPFYIIQFDSHHEMTKVINDVQSNFREVSKSACILISQIDELEQINAENFQCRIYKEAYPINIVRIKQLLLSFSR